MRGAVRCAALLWVRLPSPYPAARARLGACVNECARVCVVHVVCVRAVREHTRALVSARSTKCPAGCPAAPAAPRCGAVRRCRSRRGWLGS